MAYTENFTRELLASSKAKSYKDAISEWVDYGERKCRKSFCICGHPILENCIIRNKLNDNELIVGNCCIKKFRVNRESALKSRENYLKLASTRCSDDFERELVEDLTDWLRKYHKFRISYKQKAILERITGITWKWRQRDE